MDKDYGTIQKLIRHKAVLLLSFVFAIVLFYICANPLHIFHNSFNKKPRKDVFLENANVQNAIPFMNGLVHITGDSHDNKSQVFFIDGKGRRSIGELNVEAKNAE